MIDFKLHIRAIPDFPKPEIVFYDIGTLLAHGPAWQETIAWMGGALRALKPNVLIGIESRGFIVASALAAELGIGFVMIRKKGKLPGKTIPHTYMLEYGSDTLEIQDNVFKPGQRVVVCDDLLATGGTAAAAIALARHVGAIVVHAAFVIELVNLNGRQKLDVPVISLVAYES